MTFAAPRAVCYKCHGCGIGFQTEHALKAHTALVADFACDFARDTAPTLAETCADLFPDDDMVGAAWTNEEWDPMWPFVDNIPLVPSPPRTPAPRPLKKARTLDDAAEQTKAHTTKHVPPGLGSPGTPCTSSFPAQCSVQVRDLQPVLCCNKPWCQKRGVSDGVLFTDGARPAAVVAVSLTSAVAAQLLGALREWWPYRRSMHLARKLVTMIRVAACRMDGVPISHMGPVGTRARWPFLPVCQIPNAAQWIDATLNQAAPAPAVLELAVLRHHFPLSCKSGGAPLRVCVTLPGECMVVSKPFFARPRPRAGTYFVGHEPLRTAFTTRATAAPPEPYVFSDAVLASPIPAVFDNGRATDDKGPAAHKHAAKWASPDQKTGAPIVWTGGAPIHVTVPLNAAQSTCIGQRLGLDGFRTPAGVAVRPYVAWPGEPLEPMTEFSLSCGGMRPVAPMDFTLSNATEWLQWQREQGARKPSAPPPSLTLSISLRVVGTPRSRDAGCAPLVLAVFLYGNVVAVTTPVLLLKTAGTETDHRWPIGLPLGPGPGHPDHELMNRVLCTVADVHTEDPVLPQAVHSQPRIQLSLGGV